LSEQPAVLQDDESVPEKAGGKPMGFLGHLEELRWTLIKCAIAFAIFVTVIAYQLDRATEVLNWPLHQVQAEFPKLKNDLVTNTPMSVFSAVIDICLIGGVILSLPFWLFFVGQFVAPALTKKEMKVIVPTGLAALVLFLIGTAFGYFFLTPSTIRVAYQLNEMMGYVVMWAADRYYSLVMWMTLGMGAAFEFPLLVVLAVYMGLVEVATLRKYRRHAIVIIFIIAAVITPTPDPLNQCMFALPLIILYEVAIWVSAAIGKRREQVV
jgi:sec-independent protein translocase protein TatC